MCGIMGYIGDRNVSEVLLSGLQRLEYRGYDSAGIAILNDGKTEIVKSEGKLQNLIDKVKARNIKGKLGIGHTRWATHGKPTENNAHPHLVEKVIVVHNGIIENYHELKRDLLRQGKIFYSETDTEVIAHLIQVEQSKGTNFLHSVKKAIDSLEGSFALGILLCGNEDFFIATKRNSPLIIGRGQDENFIASDIPAIVTYTRRIKHLLDGELAIVSRKNVEIYNADLDLVDRAEKEVNWSPVMVEKMGYKHFMLKEIDEQPRAIIDTLIGRIDKSTYRVSIPELVSFDHLEQTRKIIILGCGTACHAGIIGKFIIEQLTRVPVEVDLSSEYRYRDPIIDEKTLVIPISQSGETADTIAALEEAQRRGAKSIAICNVMDSSISRIADYTLYTHAGPEIGVASTKAFTTQLTLLYLFALHLAKVRGNMDEQAEVEFVSEFLRIPTKISDIFETKEQVLEIAREYCKFTDFLYLGRGINYPIALEGALKLKEISYIHAEGYPAGEMKHGPIALIDENIPIVVAVPKGKTYEKVLGNIEEARARNGKIIAIATRGDAKIKDFADNLIFIPECSEILSPILTVIPMQLLAYYVADLLGTDVDQPRNLAKSVTVE